MSVRAGIRVNYCWVSFHFEDNQGLPTKSIPLGAIGYKNVVTIKNGSRSLSESVRVDVTLPNSQPFSSSGATEIRLTHRTSNVEHSAWTADRRAIGATKNDLDKADVTTLAAQPTQVTVELCNAYFLNPATNQYTPCAPGKSYSDVIGLV